MVSAQVNDSDDADDEGGDDDGGGDCVMVKKKTLGLNMPRFVEFWVLRFGKLV